MGDDEREMTEDLPEFDMDPENVTVDGDVAEMVEVVERRREELTEVLDEVPEDHPQHKLVRFELNTLNQMRDVLRDHPDYDVEVAGDG